MPYDFLPELAAVTAALRAGTIGEISQVWLISLVHCGPMHAQWLCTRETARQGVLLDLGVYPITSVLGWLGNAETVVAATSRLLNERKLDSGIEFLPEVEDNASRIIGFQEKRRQVVVQVNWCTGVSKDKGRYEMKIFGTQGFIKVNVATGEALFYSQMDCVNRPEQVADSGLRLNRVPVKPVASEVARKWHGPLILSRFVDKVNKSCRVEWLDMSMQEIEIISKAYESIDSGTAKEIEHRF
jgi:predicted dehydrogenase